MSNLNNSIEKKKILGKVRKFTGAGILIVTSKYNKPYIVVGREKYKSYKFDNKYVIPIYEEFGGGIQYRKNSLEENALFELKEETCNSLNWSNPKVLLKKDFKYVDIPFLNDRIYRLYIVYVHNFSKIMPTYFRNYQNIINHKTTYYKKNNYTEMDDIQLIPLDDVKKSLLNLKNVINLHTCNILKINKTEFYLSKRLYSFMNMKFNNGTGLDLCYQVFNNCFKQVGFNQDNIILLTKMSKYASFNKKYSFLDGTYYYDAL